MEGTETTDMKNAKLYILLVSSCFVANFHVSRAVSCPSISASTSCACSDGTYGKRITCSKLTTELELDRVIRCTNKYHAEEFAINDSELRFINQGSFEGATYEVLKIEMTTLTALTDRKIAFYGLEDTLRQISITDCTYTSRWDWSQLKDMRKLEAIEVIRSDIDYPIGFDQLSIKSLTRVFMTGNSELTSFPNGTFANLPALRQLMLSGNAIESIERGMLPSSLTKLDLSGNNIKNLPPGVFKDLPNLITIHLANNKFHTLDEEVFKPIWSKLSLLDFKGNPLVCDCRVKWVVNTSSSLSPRVLDVYCDAPKQLKNMNIRSVKPGELWC